MRERLLTASVDRAFGARQRWTLQLSAGAIVDGAIDVGGARHTIEPGWLAGAGLSYRFVDEGRRRPFVLGAYNLAFGSAATEDARSGARATLTALDLARIGVSVGKSFGPIAAYAAARVFGGPIFWKLGGAATTGTDRTHVQLAAGVVARPGAGLDLFAEWAFAGERRIAIGVGIGL